MNNREIALRLVLLQRWLDFSLESAIRSILISLEQRNFKYDLFRVLLYNFSFQKTSARQSDQDSFSGSHHLRFSKNCQYLRKTPR